MLAGSKSEGSRSGARLQQVRHWFLDLDGTTYLSGDPLPGALSLIDYFGRSGTGFTFLTNNSSRGSLEYAAKLTRMGFPVAATNVFTSGQATAGYLARSYPTAGVYLLGTPAFAAELNAAGVAVVEDDPDIVVLGFDPDLSFARLTRACGFIRSGTRYIASHPDVNCPIRGGYVPDAGSVMALIEASTGRRPQEIVGKPNPRFIEEAAAAAGTLLGSCAMVGDRLETDVEMALRVGIPSVLVLSGATAGDDERLNRSPWREKVEVMRGLDELLESLEERLRSGTA